MLCVCDRADASANCSKWLSVLSNISFGCISMTIYFFMTEFKSLRVFCGNNILRLTRLNGFPHIYLAQCHHWVFSRFSSFFKSQPSERYLFTHVRFILGHFQDMGLQCLYLQYMPSEVNPSKWTRLNMIKKTEFIHMIWLFVTLNYNVQTFTVLWTAVSKMAPKAKQIIYIMNRPCIIVFVPLH